MCGIAGFRSTNGAAISDEVLKQTSELLKHRGPDANGSYRSGDLTLIHSRLKIVDLSDQANQPMLDKNSGCALVFNGEIYNFKTLKASLISKGHAFLTQSDTEVLLQGLVAFGSEFLKELEGDFALAFWNPKIELLLLARDRYGVKPLYVAENSNGLYFSSEIKPLFAMGFSKELRRESLSDYFRFRYVPGLKTLFKGIEHLPPGHFLEITKDSKKLLAFADGPNAENLNFKDAFKDSVQERTEADVEVGLLLSGGVDSSAVAFQIKDLNKKLRAFTFSFYKRSKADADVEQAKAFALALKLPHETVNETKDSFLLYPKVLKALEEPLGDSIILANYELFQQISKSLKVVISGEGADEIFSGYAHHRAGQVLVRIAGYPFFQKILKYLVYLIPSRLLDVAGLYPANVARHAKERLLACLRSGSENEIFKSLAALFTEEEIAQLLLNGISSSDLQFKNDIKTTDIKNWLPRYGLVRTDKLSMAHSLEVRVPYLSRHLNDVARSEGFDSTNLWMDKPKFRKFCLQTFGLNLISRRFKKFPFFLPKENYLDSNYLKFVKETLKPERIRKYWLLNDLYVSKLVSEAEVTSDFLRQKQVTAILILQIWLETFWPDGLN